MSSNPQETGHDGSLQKSLSPIQVWALALGSIVGWGCFVLPGDSFLPNSGPMAALIGFAAGAFLLMFVAQAYAHMINYCPVAGGEYAYAYIGYGPTPSFICGWMLALGYLSIICINISAFALLFRFLLPGVFDFGPLYKIAGWQVYTGEVLLMMGIAAFFGIMNYRGINIAGALQVFLAFMLSGGILCLFFGTVSLDTFSLSNLKPLFAESRPALSSVLAILAIAPFLFVGFDTVPQAAEEFNFPSGKAKKIMLAAIAWGGCLYAMVTFSCASAIPYPDMLARMAELKAAGSTAWATGEVARMAFGNLGSLVLACGVLGAVCTGMNGFYVATTRLFLAMARGKILPPWFGAIHPRYGSPYKAILFTMAICLLTPFAGRAVVGWIVDMSSVGTAIAYLFTCLTAVKVLKASKAPGSSMPIFYANVGALVSVVCIVLLLVPGSPGYIELPSRILLAIWAIMGVIFYFSSRKHWAELPKNELTNAICGTPDMPTYFK